MVDHPQKLSSGNECVISEKDHPWVTDDDK